MDIIQYFSPKGKRNRVFSAFHFPDGTALGVDKRGPLCYNGRITDETSEE